MCSRFPWPSSATGATPWGRPPPRAPPRHAAGAAPGPNPGSTARPRIPTHSVRPPLAADLCSGITALCLNDDIKAPRPYNTTCRVLPDEMRGCGDNPDLPTLCSGGVCMCEQPRPGRAREQSHAPLQPARALPAPVDAPQPRPRTLPSRHLPRPPPRHRAADASGVPVPSRADVEEATLERARAFSASTTTWSLQELRARRQAAPLPGVAGGATPQFGPDLNLTVYVDADTVGRFVPASFIGISREYTNESIYWDRNLPAWGAILDVLGPSPVVRLGGASQEALTAPPTAEYMRSLVALHCALGVRYIIGLPLFQNAPALALQIKQAYDQAFANFPRAILSYELGNEARGGRGPWGLWGLPCLTRPARVRNLQAGIHAARVGGPAMGCRMRHAADVACASLSPLLPPPRSPTTGRLARQAPSSGAPARRSAPR